MILTKRLLLALVAAGLASVSASATPITNTWYIGGNGSATGGFAFTDGTTVTGSFTYDASSSTANCGAGCNNPTPGSAIALSDEAPAPNDYNGLYGLFGNGSTTTGGLTGSISVSLGSFFGATPPSLTWYINTNDFDVSVGAQCCSDSTNLYLVSANPVTTADMTDLAYNPNDPSCSTDTPGSMCTDHPGADAAYGIFTTFGAMTDAGNLYAPGDLITSALLGVCDTAQCGGIDTATQITSTDSTANVNTGLQPVSASPEPSTFLLGASVLAIGAFRRKLFRSRQ